MTRGYNMNIEKTIQYLQDIVDLETQKNIAYNTYQKLTAMEKQKEYANKVDVNRPIETGSVREKISWSDIWKRGCGIYFILFIPVALLMRLLLSIIKNGGVAVLVFYVVLIGVFVYIVRGELSKAHNAVEEEKFEKQKYVDKAKQDQLILVQIQKEKPMLNTVYNQCITSLRKLYSMNIIHPDYQDFVACGMFLQYLSTGRTHSLEQCGGDPGAYNLYEQDVKFNVIKKQLDQIQKNQQVIYGALVQINQNVQDLCSSVERIENYARQSADYARQTAHNTKISAWCDQVNAINIYAMRRMAEGYR